MSPSEGDRVVEWDTGEVDTVQDAAATFAQLLLQGHVGFATTLGGSTKKLDKFDPEVGRIVMAMPLAGG